MVTATRSDARVPVTPRTTIVALGLFAAALVLLSETLVTLDRPTRAVVWGGLALATYAVGFLCLVGGRQGTGLGLIRWRFGSWILAWWSVSYGIATVTWSQSQAGTVAAQIALPSVLRALWLVAVGMTMWILGYLVGPGWPIRRLAARGVEEVSRRFTAEVRSPLAPWILYAVGSAARILSAVTSGRFGYVGNASLAVSTASGYEHILSLAGYCAPLAVSAAAMKVYKGRQPSARITLIILLFIELAIDVASGVKENFLLAVVAFLIPYCAARRQLPKAALTAVILAFLLVIVPFNSAYRSVVRTGRSTLTSAQAFDAAPQILRKTLTANGLMAIFPHSANYLLLRIREIDAPAIILQRTPAQVSFVSPAQLITVPVAGMVPRWIWPSKPLSTPGYEMTQMYYGQPATLYTASTTTSIGSLFQHGGWWPVIIGMFLFGCLVRLLDDVLDVFANPHAIFLVPLLLPSLVIAEGGLDSILADIASAVVIWVLAVILIFRPRCRI